MKKTAGLAMVLALFSLNGWAQEQSYDERNKYIFCASHLALVSDSLDEQGKERQALMYLSGMHRESGMKLGATEKHFADVYEYLKKVRKNDKRNWAQLSNQSRMVCLPGSGGAAQGEKGS